MHERRPAWVILQCEAITDIDVTAAGMLERLDNELNAKGVHLAFVELRTRLRDLVHDYGLLKTLDRDHFYASIDEALIDITTPPARTSRSPEVRRRSGSTGLVDRLGRGGAIAASRRSAWHLRRRSANSARSVHHFDGGASAAGE